MPAGALRGRHGEGALATKAGIREAEMHTALEAGACIQHFMVVRRTGDKDVEYVVYLRVSWRAGYHILTFAHDSRERRFRTFEAVQQFAVRFQYAGPIVVYRAGDPALGRFKGVAVADGGTVGPGPGRRTPRGADQRSNDPADSNAQSD